MKYSSTAGLPAEGALDALCSFGSTDTVDNLFFCVDHTLTDDRIMNKTPPFDIDALLKPFRSCRNTAEE